MNRKSVIKWVAGLALGVAAVSAAPTFAQEQFVPLLSYRVGPYAAGGSGFFGGFIDYVNLVNANGGINGVKLTWEECETEYNASRGVECYERLKKKSGGASTIEPLSTGIAYGILDRVATDKVPMTTFGYGNSAAADGRVFPWVFPLITNYWSQAAGMIKYLSDKEGGYAKLKGKKIVHLYHDSAYGKEPIPVFEALSAKYGYELVKLAVPHPGNDQQSQWLQIRQAKPDYVILWGWGVMNPTAIKAAQRAGYPREKMLGVWWAGSEEDVIPAGDAAKNYVTTTFTPSGSYPVVEEIRKKVYGSGKGNLDDKSRIGSVYHIRGIANAIVIVEAMRNAQAKFGKGKVLTGEQVRWGLENLNIDEARLKALGAPGLIPVLKTSCMDHEGSGVIKVQKWDGAKWTPITKDWISGDRDLIRKMEEDAATSYAAEKKITRACL